MDKRKEFIERLSQGLMRFNIQDKFGQMDTKIARLKIAEYAYQVLEEIAKEIEQQKPSSTVEEAISTYEEIQKSGEENGN
jgi:hypothetical protein